VNHQKRQKTWYVSTRVPDADKKDHYSRRSQTFASESAAKRYAADKVADGAEVSAGTLNPAAPKRIIGPSDIKKWLAEETGETARNASA